ncbi:M24 family metallopeptidase [Actinomycetospora lemnae]|uniref:Xaa-Pro peptidase family protein n=1 Tax=Actinomycetospora lemnae TaxID=3019891 RepID=A0ABT5SYB7_9PSEU|nr:Xaa-Pro peptidase family protein [Actinomycetospora sp. DW7H6]MDD7967852.1 Xaa-Pro peptidase family protein [Actinomycetospora sp. DW7H6]
MSVDVDLRELGAERLARAQASLRAHDLPAALLFDPGNVRYVTSDGSYLVANLHVSYRWALAFAEHAPILWEPAESIPLARSRFDGEVRPTTSFTFFGSGDRSGEHARTAMTEVRDELRARGLADAPLGIDRAESVVFLALADLGVRVVDAVGALEVARAVKTDPELAIHRENARLTDEAVGRFLEHLEPGRTERELWARLMYECFTTGGMHSESRLLCSGPRTNPWMQEATGRVVRGGEAVAFDTDLVGPHGYLTDISRTYVCGDAAPSTELRDVYQAAYGFVHAAIPEFRSGRSFAELGELLGPRLPAEYRAQRYPFLAHGCGAADEYPAIVVDGHHGGVLEPGMVISVEGYMGRVGGAAGAKYEEQIVITDGAPELISSAPAEPRLL